MLPVEVLYVAHDQYATMGDEYCARLITVPQWPVTSVVR